MPAAEVWAAHSAALPGATGLDRVRPVAGRDVLCTSDTNAVA